MNTIVLTNPAPEEDFNPIDRARANVALTASNHLVGGHPRPLLLIGREPFDGLPSRHALLLLDTLLPISWERLEHANEEFQFAARGPFLKTQIGEQRRSSNDRLDAAFDVLNSFSWRLPQALMSASFSVGTILADWHKCERRYIWRFTPEFIVLCQTVPLWVKYPTCYARLFRKPIAHRLHELLTVFTGRKFPIWNVPVTELLRLIGASKHDYTSDRFIKQVVEPALAEVERVTGWTIVVECFPHPLVAPTERLRFTILRGQSSRLAAVAK